MALYIPAGRRRRRTAALTAVALLVGVVAGGLVGRASAPSVEDRIHSVQALRIEGPLPRPPGAVGHRTSLLALAVGRRTRVS